MPRHVQVILVEGQLLSDSSRSRSRDGNVDICNLHTHQTGPNLQGSMTVLRSPFRSPWHATQAL